MGGDDDELDQAEDELLVSIHAPAWGATENRYYIYSKHPVSIHAPAWGATCMSVTVSTSTTCFNPRPRMEGDIPPWGRNHKPNMFQSTPPHGGRLSDNRHTVNRMAVSIHAPAWGATDSA